MSNKLFLFVLRTKKLVLRDKEFFCDFSLCNDQNFIVAVEIIILSILIRTESVTMKTKKIT